MKIKAKVKAERYIPNRRVPGRVYIGELGKLVHRSHQCMRSWQAQELLPEHLLPKRDHENWRYWTDEQVFGKDGIIAWMKKNDMRPGNTMTDPKDEYRHIDNLHRPKFLKKRELRDVEQMIREGCSRTEILIMIFPRTTYTNIEGLEAALTKHYKYHDKYFPPKFKVKPEDMSPALKRELAMLEKKIAKLHSKGR